MEVISEATMNCSTNTKDIGPMTSQTKKVVILDSRDTEALEHQVAGHSKIGVGVLRHKSGFVMKPKQDDTRWGRELEFYRKVYETKSTITGLRSQLQSLTPSFYGVSSVVTSDGGQRKEYLMLQDIVDGFKKPCVLDIKMGAVTWDPYAPLSKIEAEIKKYMGTKNSLGISIAGMYYFDIEMQKFIRKERHFGRELNHDTLYESMKDFVNYRKSTRSKFVLKEIIEKLQIVNTFFKNQTEFAFYSSSILIAYDAFLLEEISRATSINDIGDGHEEGRGDMMSNRVRAIMIDFAHVFPLETTGASRDDNYLFGLRNVLELFQAIYEDKAHFMNTKVDISVEVLQSSC